MRDAKLKRKLFLWEFVCLCVLILPGGVMHSLYQDSGYWIPVALIAPVNESIWEHMKMFFWPGLAFALFQYLIVRPRVDNYWCAKLVALTITPAMVALTFVAYVVIAKALDIFPVEGITRWQSIGSVVVGQLCCYRVMITESKPAKTLRLAPFGYATIVLAFSLFTYFPPEMYLFEHHQNFLPAGQYGLEVDRYDSGKH
jgi:hypothetical protein